MSNSLEPSKTLPTLYTLEGSSNSYKITLLASLLDIKLEHRIIDLQKDEQHSPEYVAINPRAQIPALAHGEHVFNDSAAIITYLAATNPDPGSTTTPSSYWSVDAAEQAKIIDWIAFGASWIQFGVFTCANIVSYGGTYNGLGAGYSQQTLNEAIIRSHKSLEILDSHLAKEKWLALGRPTIADIAVFPSVGLAPMGDISLEKYTNVKRWIQDIRNLKGFRTLQGLDDPYFTRRGK